ncbi:MAG: heme o synthase [Pirellulales bacterium]
MSYGTIAAALGNEKRTNTLGRKLAAYFELTKPKIAVMALLTVAAAFAIGSSFEIDTHILIATLVGTALVASAASASNHWIERDLDARMPRTAERPLPSGTLGTAEALGFVVVTLVAGLIVLLSYVNVWATFFALCTFLGYVCVYTPMKTASSANTAVGAVAGALPVLVGWAAVEAPLRFNAAGIALTSLFLVLYLWQFPHFMAIAWLYRRDYAAGGMRMLTVDEPSGKHAGRLAFRTSLALLPISYLPFVKIPDWIYHAPVLLLGAGYAALAWRFFRSPDDVTARRLLRYSLVYLPLWMLMLVIAPKF